MRNLVHMQCRRRTRFFDAEVDLFERQGGCFTLDTPEFGMIQVLSVDREPTRADVTVYRSFEILMMEAILPQDRLAVHRLKRAFNAMIVEVEDAPENQSGGILGGENGTDRKV